MYHYTFGEYTIYFYETHNWNGGFMGYGYKFERNGWLPTKQRGWRNIKPTVKIINDITDNQWLTDEIFKTMTELKAELEEEGIW